MAILQIQLRNDTAVNWTTNDPILLVGEVGYESDTGRFKFGDAVSVWSALTYTDEAEVAHIADASIHIPEAATDNKYYGRINATWANLSDHFLRSDQSDSMTGTLTMEGQLNFAASNPVLQFDETSGAAVDEAHWQFNIDNGQFRFRAYVDAWNAWNDIFTVDRTGSTVDTFNVQATNLQSNGVNVALSTDLGTVASLDTGVLNGNVPLVGVGNVIPTSILPALAITDTFPVASEVAMLALSTAGTGDVAVRTDINTSFILAGTDPAILGDWQELLTPTDAVASVDGRTGVVTLSDLYEPTFTKNTGFNLNLGTIAGTVSEGNHTHNYEDALGNPTTDGYVLSSTIAGVRSWIAPATGGLSDAVSDGVTYGRRDAAWAEVIDTLGGQIIDGNLNINDGRLALTGDATFSMPYSNDIWTHAWDNILNVDWVKIADVSIGTGLYESCVVRIDLYISKINYGETTDPTNQTYFAVMNRSAGSQDSQDTGWLIGPNVGKQYIRLHKVSLGVFEIHFSPNSTYDFNNIKMQQMYHPASTEITYTPIRVTSASPAATITGVQYDPEDGTHFHQQRFDRVTANEVWTQTALGTGGDLTVDGATTLSGLTTVSSGTNGYAWTPNSRDVLLLDSNNAAGTTLSIQSLSTAISGIYFGDENSETSGQIQWDNPTNKFSFYAISGDRFTIDANGTQTWTGSALADVLHTGGGQTVAGDLTLDAGGITNLVINSSSNRSGLGLGHAGVIKGALHTSATDLRIGYGPSWASNIAMTIDSVTGDVTVNNALDVTGRVSADAGITVTGAVSYLGADVYVTTGVLRNYQNEGDKSVIKFSADSTNTDMRDLVYDESNDAFGIEYASGVYGDILHTGGGQAVATPLVYTKNYDIIGLNTSTTNIGEWIKFLTVTINTQYNDFDGGYVVTAVGHGAGEVRKYEMHLRVKQQNVFGSDPFVQGKLINIHDATDNYEVAYIIEQNTPSTIVTFYLQNNASHSTPAIKEISRSGFASYEYFSTDGWYTTAGLVGEVLIEKVNNITSEGGQTIADDLTVSGVNGIITANSTAGNSQFRLEEDDQAVDNRNWSFVAEAGTLSLRAYNDAYTVESYAIYFGRAGTVPTVPKVTDGAGTLYDIIHAGGGQTINGNFTINTAGNNLRLSKQEVEGTARVAVEFIVDGVPNWNLYQEPDGSLDFIKASGSGLLRYNSNEILHAGGGQTINGALTTTSLRLTSGPLTFDSTSMEIKAQADDARRIVIAGGSAAATANGAYITISGNDYGGTASGGDIRINAGNEAGSTIELLGESNVTGKLSATGAIIAGSAGAGPALTITDGYGNSNLAFNHTSGLPGTATNVGRIKVNTSAITSAVMEFGVKTNTGLTAVAPTYTMQMYESLVVINGDANVTGDISVGNSGGGDSWIHFHDDNSNVERSFGWDDSANDWSFETEAGGTIFLNDLANNPTYLDNDHLYLGSSNDLDIYHSGTTGYIDNNTGSLQFDTAATYIWAVAGANKVSMNSTSLYPNTSTVGLGNSTLGWNSLYFDERSADVGHAAGTGQLWVRNDTPNTLVFTDDAGADHEVAGAALGTSGVKLVDTITISGAPTTIEIDLFGGYTHHRIVFEEVTFDTTLTTISAYLVNSTETFNQTGDYEHVHITTGSTSVAAAASTNLANTNLVYSDDFSAVYELMGLVGGSVPMISSKGAFNHDAYADDTTGWMGLAVGKHKDLRITTILSVKFIATSGTFSTGTIYYYGWNDT